MADGQVVFEITGDGTKAKAAINDVIKAMQDAGVKLDREAKTTSDSVENKFTSAFKKIGVAALAMKAGKALLDFGKDAIQAASDLEEVQNVVDVTFGDNAGQIEKWAKNAGTQFGLTETQAKKFTSTLGAMMKSAGLAGPEIVDMSTDLAGLAADMASFYNLDFDTAFQKIRSGISGETEPLKQLGINMSVANLEAFALTQGITKAFNEMSQGEQTMLRYQYLMQATADAQGDFARTSDGYANSVRALETNIASLKTSVGEILLPIVSNVVSFINDMVSALTQEAPTTVLDDFAAIDLDTETKMAEIEATADKARDLISVLGDIQTDVDAMSRKNIDFGDWSDVLDVIDAFGNFKPSGNAGKSITDLADALNGNDPNTDRAQAWQELLGALSTDVEGLSKLTGKSPEETKKWLEEIAVGANSLDPNSAEGWDSLFQHFTEGLPGLSDTSMGGVLGALAGDADNASRYLEALGYDTDDVADAHAKWLKVCKQLVQEMPGLNEIINTETGEVKGGAKALSDYVDTWQKEQQNLLRWKAYYAKKDALIKKQAEIEDYWVDAKMKEHAKERAIADIEKKYGSLEAFESAKTAEDFSNAGLAYASSWQDYNKYKSDEVKKDAEELTAAIQASDDATAEYTRQNEALIEANKELDELYPQLVDELGEYNGELEDGADATAEWSQEMQDAAGDAVQALADALKAVQDYYDAIYDETKKNVESVADGFAKIVTPAEKARAEMQDLDKQLKDGTLSLEDYNKQWTGLNDAVPTIQNMTEGLKDQTQYWIEYLRYLQQARANGVSEDILAFLSDGSTESFDYLKALGSGTMSADEIAALNEAYAAKQAAQEAATAELTNTRLGADKEFQSLVDAANEAAGGLDVYAEAESAMENTVQGIADGIAAKLPEVQQQVDALNAILGSINPTVANFLGPNFKIDGSHANGLDYVPFDNYLAQLHEGESILTAEEARVWREFKTGGASVANTIDYDAMGGVMRDNIKPGGNVYLDGRVVGAVISQQQGNSYRALERSGWQR